ncbi:hypothetical protein DY000_02033599 [Brassica cretica]|uniref:Uncharacterized protein n=1 Tax=Brassica cretica TaxID=69181 RepID=A0ABQ7DRY6_BRACR|nr:hypothetical protein DY000_02033599 [Brassica cretica]
MGDRQDANRTGMVVVRVPCETGLVLGGFVTKKKTKLIGQLIGKAIAPNPPSAPSPLPQLVLVFPKIVERRSLSPYTSPFPTSSIPSKPVSCGLRLELSS